jgi:hypothetical protein
LYEAAILELDRGQVLQRIAEAQRAIMDRMEDMNRSENGPESEALINALNVLRDLRKMADGKGQFQE